jgi:hypothetical protein
VGLPGAARVLRLGRPLTPHSLENVGAKELRNITFELKQVQCR